MATKVFMEALSPTMEEGRLVKWLHREGDVVKSGDTLAEVETDKAIMELVARGDGVLRKRLLGEGETIAVGSLIGVIAANDENIDALLGGAASAAPIAEPRVDSPQATTGQGDAGERLTGGTERATASPRSAGATTPASAAHDRPVAVASITPAATTGVEIGRAKTSPLARRLASERGIDLTSLQGSGPGGRIVKRDIESVVPSESRPGVPAPSVAVPSPIAPPAQAAPPIAISSGGDHTDVALTQIRKTIARRLAESIGPVPTFYLTGEFDMERVADMRSAMAELGDGYKVSFNDIVLKAVATALLQHPECNAHWLGDSIRYFGRVHLGMAVAIPDGLITPVIFDAHAKRLSEIARESRDLAARARDRRLKPNEYTGSTFSVSNLGMFGIDDFTAIINPPEAGIVAIGAIEQKPVAVDGAVVVRRRMRITMSCDHRVIDGASGARFLQTLRRLIENPLLLVY